MIRSKKLRNRPSRIRIVVVDSAPRRPLRAASASLNDSM
jgi:hypothetical protein